MRAGRLLLPFAALGLLLTSGCAWPDPEPVASGSAAAGEAFFASEEEAVEAALAVYEKYVTAVNMVMADGGNGGERLLEFASPEVYEQEEAGFAVLRAENATAVGETIVDGHAVQSVDDEAGIVAFYVCRDVSAVQILDDEGNDLVSDERPDRATFESFVSADEDGRLLVSRDAPWAGEGIC